MSEEKEFDDNYKKYRSYVYHVIGRYISDACTIEDLTQHTFMKAWVKRHTFRGDSAYSTWLFKIAVNTALSHLISGPHVRQKRHNPYIEGSICQNVDILDEAISTQEIDNIKDALLRLPVKMADLIILYAIYGLSYEEIAKINNIKIGTLRSRLHQARYLLKKELQ